MGPVIWFLLFFLILYGLGRLYAPLWKRRLFRVILFPGFLLAALLQMLACGISGAEVRKVYIFSNRKGLMERESSLVSLLGRIILAMLPFIGMLLIILLLLFFFSGSAEGDAPPKTVSPFAGVSGQHLSPLIKSVFLSFKKVFKGERTEILLLCYLLFSFIIAMAPAPADMKFGLIGAVIAGIVCAVVLWLAAGTSFAWQFRHLFLLLGVVLLFIAAVSLVVLGSIRLASALTSKRNRGIS